MQFVFHNHSKQPHLCAFGHVDQVKAGSPQDLKEFLKNYAHHYKVGIIGYDALSKVHKNKRLVNTPELHFVVPEFVKISDREEDQYFKQTIHQSEKISQNEYLKHAPKSSEEPKVSYRQNWASKVSQNDYLDNFKVIQNHLQQGNIYEMNYCIPFEAEANVDAPYALFKSMQNSMQAPMAGYFSCDHHHLLSFSPERYVQKTGNKLKAQPIKGTSARNENPAADNKNKESLYNSQKERSENVMIVDLVRNDLSKIAKKNSVEVDELFGIYSFPTVYQMISTISCSVDDQIGLSEILEASFPMGSMTGAPKDRAMEIIEALEIFSRGWYSGALGYIKPNGDFDFNVVIRSIIYDEQSKKLVCPVGSAVTIYASADEEYKECQLKFEGVKKAIDAHR